MGESVERVLVGSGIQQYRRHRWKGLEFALNDYILFRGCWELLSDVYPQWCMDVAVADGKQGIHVADSAEADPEFRPRRRDAALRDAAPADGHAHGRATATAGAHAATKTLVGGLSLVDKDGAPLSEFDRKNWRLLLCPGKRL